nr:matrix protein [Measles morbillivirus]
MTEIHDFDKSA